jgi:molybdate transport system permease protein
MKTNTIRSGNKFSFFKTGMVSVLFALVTSILLLIVADILYINGPVVSEMLKSQDIRYALILTVLSSVLTTILAVLVAIPSAYALSRYNLKGAIFWDTLVDLLIVIPVLVIGVSILVFFRMGTLMAASTFPLTSFIGSIIQSLGSFFIYTKQGIVLAQFFCAIPFAVRVIKSTFDNINPRTEQVALTLGCTHSQAFRLITLPLAKHGIVAGAVLAWARAFGLFGPVSIVAGAVRQKTEVLATSIFLEISIGRLELAIAISLMMIFLASCVLITTRLISGKNLFGFGGVYGGNQ